MADNVTTQAGTLATVPSGTKIATREVTYSGDSATQIAPVGIVTFSGSDDAKTATDISNSNPLPISDAGGSLTIDGSVSISSLPALAAGTNNIGDVDVLTVPAPLSTTGGGTEAAALRVTLANDSTGLVSVDDNGSSLTVDGTVAATQSGTWSVRTQDGAGNALTSKVAGSERAISVAIVDGSGNQVTSFGGSGGTSATDDSAFTPASGSGTPIMGFADETAPDAVDEGDVGVVRMTLARGLHVNLRDASGNAITALPVTDNAGSLTVDNAGTFATQIDGAALTALQLLDDAVKTDDTAFTPATDKVLMIGAQLDDTTPDVVDEGDAGALRMSAARALHTTIRDAAGNNRGANVDSNANLMVHATGSSAQDAPVANNPVLVGFRASTVTPSAMSANGDAVYPWADLNGAPVVAGRLVDDAAFTPGTDRVHPVGFTADETATDSVDEGDIGAARMTLDRRQIVVPQPHATGGCSIFRSLDLDETEEEVKATAGTLYGYFIANLATATRFVKFYNATAANVTVGTTTPVMTLVIPGNATDDVAANLLGGVGIEFTTAITVAATTGLADADTGAPGANEVVVNIYFK